MQDPRAALEPDLESSIPRWRWDAPLPVPGQLVYLREAQSQIWHAGLMLGEHPSRTGLIFLALTHGACQFIDPGDEASDACGVTDFEEAVPSQILPGSYEPFSEVAGGGTCDDLLEWGAKEFLTHQRGMLRGGAKKGRLPKKTAAGTWVSMASIAEDAAIGMAAIEVGDIIVPDASKGLVLLTLLWEEEDWSVADTLSWFLSERIVICELSGLFLASAFFWLI